MTKILDLFETLFKLISASLVTAMVSVVLLQVFARFFLPSCPSWTEELSRFLYIHTIGFAAPVALRSDLLVKVDLLTNALPHKANRFILLITNMAVLAISAIFTYTAYGFMMSGLIEKSIALVWPMVIPFSAMFICGCFLTIFSIERLVKFFISAKEKGGNT